MKHGWVDTIDCVPLADGDYIVQTVFGSTGTMMYTLKGGWNTYYDNKGILHNNNPMPDGYVARWYAAPTPPKVPALWKKEYLERRSNEVYAETMESDA